MDVYRNVAHLKSVPYGEYLLYKKNRYSLLKGLSKSICLDVLFGDMSRPIMLDCETINTCTNDCIICAYGKMKRKKTIMPMERFEKVLHDYSEMGGGYLSLTPRGEIFLDPFLMERISLLEKYPRIKGISVTTNAVPVDRLSDRDLEKILNSFIRIHISIYGLDNKEYSLMTRRDFYSRVVSNIKKILELTDRNKTSICFGFKLLKDHSEMDIQDWIKNNLGTDDIPYGYTYTYTNFRGAVNDEMILPFKGRWQKRTQGTGHCLMPMIEGAIYSNGDVSYCPCTEFDIINEFKLGNIDDLSLSEIFNSGKNKELWNNLPRTCLICTFYCPITGPSQLLSVFQDPVSHIGG
jgi:radical SAM protein with 4Fe4S-binding SPASM domain